MKPPPDWEGSKRLTQRKFEQGFVLSRMKRDCRTMRWLIFHTLTHCGVPQWPRYDVMNDCPSSQSSNGVVGGVIGEVNRRQLLSLKVKTARKSGVSYLIR